MSKLIEATEAHEIAYQDVCSLIDRHAGKLGGLELLAVAANLVGKLIAFQDQRTVTPELAGQVVRENIESGNRQAMERLSRTVGNA